MTLNNHRNTINSPKAIPVCSDYRKLRHDVINHEKVILIEQLKKNEIQVKTY